MAEISSLENQPKKSTQTITKQSINKNKKSRRCQQEQRREQVGILGVRSFLDKEELHL